MANIVEHLNEQYPTAILSDEGSIRSSPMFHVKHRGELGLRVNCAKTICSDEKNAWSFPMFQVEHGEEL
jgi:hypothetical protein